MSQLLLTTLPNIPLVQRGDDLTQIILQGLSDAGITLQAHDVLILASKIVSKSEGMVVRLDNIKPSVRAIEYAQATNKDAREVELVLQQTLQVVRSRKGLMLTRHRLGFVSANAGIDHSNVQEGAADHVLLLPEDPDASAEKIRTGIMDATGTDIAVILADSHGRPYRLGTVGVAIGAAGLPALEDWRGREDLFGYTLKSTDVGLADMLASAASILFGQASEATPVVHARGAVWQGANRRAQDLVRSDEQDLFG